MSSDLKISQMTFSGARPVNNDIPWVGGTPIDNYRSTLQDITGMYSNFTAGDRALAGVPTAGWSAAGGVYFVVNGGAIYPYLARAGTDAQSVPNIIRPTDYAGGTNELVFDLLTFYTDGVIVGNGSITDTTPGLVVAAGGSGNRNIFLTPTGASGNVTVGTSGILVLDNGASQATFSAAGTAVWTGAASLTPGAGTNLNISLTSTALASVTNSSGATMRLNNTGTTAVSQYELYSSATSFGSLSYAPAGGANDGLIVRDGRTDAQAKVVFQLQSAEVARLVAGNLLLGTTTNTAGSGNLVVAGGTVTAGAAATPLTLSGGSSGASLVLGQGASGSALVTPGGVAGFLRVSKSMPSTSQFTSTGSLQLINTDTTDGNWNSIDFVDSIGGGTAAGIYAKHTDHANDYAELHLVTRGAGGLASRGIFTSTGNLLIGTTTDMASTAGGLTVAATGSGATATAVNTGGLRSANFGLSTVSGGASYFGGNLSLIADGTNSRYIALLNSSSSYAGRVVLQAGGGSAAFGGALVAYGHSHATRPGWVTAGISAGSGGKFSVNDSALGDGTDVFTVTGATGAATFAGAVSVTNTTPSTGVGTGALQVAGGIYAGAASVFGGVVSSSNSFNVADGGIYGYGAATTYIQGNAASAFLSFVTSSTERLRLSSTGATFAGAVTMSAALANFGNGTAGTEVRVSGDGSATPYGYWWRSGTTYEASMQQVSSTGVLTLDVGRNSSWGGKFDIYVDTVRSARFAKNLTTFDQPATFAGAVTVSSTTASTGVGTGALQVAGGIYAGAASVFTGTSTFNIGNSGQVTIASNGAATDTPLQINNTAQSWQMRLNGANGALWFYNVTGGSVPLFITTTGAATFAGATLTLAPAAAEATITSKGRATGTNPLATTSRGGSLTLTNLDTTDNNAEAVSFHNSNDLAIASIVAQNVSHAGRTGKLYFNVSNGSAPVEALSLASTGAATFAGAVTVSNTTTATNTTSGALIVGSNVGLSGNAGGASYFGGNLTVNLGADATSQITVGSAGGSPTANRIQRINLTTPSSGSFPGQADLLFTRNASPVWRVGFAPTASGASTTNSDFVFANAGDLVKLAIAQDGSILSSGNATFAGAVSVTNTTASTGLGTGALQVAGGIYAGAASVFAGAVTTNGALFTQSASLPELRISDTNGTGTFGQTFYGGGNYEASIKYATNLGVMTIDAGRNSSWGSKIDLYVDTVRSARFAKTLTTFDQAATFAGTVTTSSATLSGAGAIPITTSLVKFTSTGAANALTLANGVDGQRLTIVHDVKGTLGTGVLTPTTKTGFSTVTFTNAGDTVDLVYVTTRGWMVTGSYLATIAP